MSEPRAAAGTFNLRRLLRPATVAVAGASLVVKDT